MNAAAVRELTIDGEIDLRHTLAHLTAGRGDPTFRVGRDAVLRATRTPAGPATLGIERNGPGLRAMAWGPGAEWVLERAGDFVGLADDPAPALPPDAAPIVQELAGRLRGLRLARTHRVVEMLTVFTLQQLVTGKESKRAFRRLARARSEPAPGPADDLWLPLSPAQLRELPPALFPPLGIPARQGETLRRLGEHADRLEEAAAMSPAEAEARLRSVRGIGIWTARLALVQGLGAPDAVPVGDYHLPSVVAYNLAGEPRADDARMLELLAPYAGQRGRVARWLATGGRSLPRRGPRRAIRELPEGADRFLRR